MLESMRVADERIRELEQEQASKGVIPATKDQKVREDVAARQDGVSLGGAHALWLTCSRLHGTVRVRPVAPIPVAHLWRCAKDNGQHRPRRPAHQGAAGGGGGAKQGGAGMATKAASPSPPLAASRPANARTCTRALRAFYQRVTPKMMAETIALADKRIHELEAAQAAAQAAQAVRVRSPRTLGRAATANCCASESRAAGGAQSNSWRRRRWPTTSR